MRECIAEHNCIIDSNFRIGKHWPIVSPDGRTTSVEVKSRVAANSPRAVKEITVAGGGIGMIPRFIVEKELEKGFWQVKLPHPGCFMGLLGPIVRILACVMNNARHQFSASNSIASKLVRNDLPRFAAMAAQ